MRDANPSRREAGKKRHAVDFEANTLGVGTGLSLCLRLLANAEHRHVAVVEHSLGHAAQQHAH